MSTSSAATSLTLTNLHLRDVVGDSETEAAAEAEESGTSSSNQPSSPPPFISPTTLKKPTNYCRRVRPRATARLYAVAAYDSAASNPASLRPEELFLTEIHLSGPTRQDADVAIMRHIMGMDLQLSSSSSSRRRRWKVFGFCFLVPPEGGDANFCAPVMRRHHSPGTCASEWVREIKKQSISDFTLGHVFPYLAEHRSPGELTDYLRMKNRLTESQLWNLDSTRIWNMLYLSRGGKIEEALVEHGVVEALIHIDDLDLPKKQLVPVPTPVITVGSEESDGRKNAGDQKRKAVAAMEEDEDHPCPYDHWKVVKKKGGHSGNLRIDEPRSPTHAADEAADGEG